VAGSAAGFFSTLLEGRVKVRLIIPGDPAHAVPELRFQANPVYNLYHYLRTVAERPQPPAVPPPQEIARLAPQVRRQRLPQPLGLLWSRWEEAIAASTSAAELRSSGPWRWRHSPRRLFALMARSEEPYREHVWPQHQPAIHEALDTIRRHLMPCYEDLFAGHARLLRMHWPPSITVHLVGDCYLAQGGYSHPLTVDAHGNRGLQLIETVLHEATHVMDMASPDPGRASAVLLRALGAGRLKLSPRRHLWQVWHGLIFWSAGEAVQRFFDPTYDPYALRFDLYRQMSLIGRDDLYEEPWRRYTAGELSLEEMARLIAERVHMNHRPVRLRRLLGARLALRTPREH